MRDIKFHAWDKVNNVIVDVEAIRFKFKTILVNGVWRWLEDFELLQYIGKQDNHGKEIYEGHVVYCENDECIGYIANSDEEEGYFFMLQNENGEFEQRDIYDYIGSIEIIGDVYNNPEMVEGC